MFLIISPVYLTGAVQSNVVFFSPNIIIYLPKSVSIWEKKDRTWEIILTTIRQHAK